MKPLPAASLTTEDLDIWARALMEWTTDRTPGWVRLDAQAADRRDAELMFRIEVCRQWERDHPEEFAGYLEWGWVHAMIDSIVEDPGTCIRFAESDITYSP